MQQRVRQFWRHCRWSVLPVIWFAVQSLFLIGPAAAQAVNIGGCRIALNSTSGSPTDFKDHAAFRYGQGSVYGLKCPRSNFAGIDLRGQIFLIDSDLSGSSFHDANLEDLNLWKADLRHSDFTGANMVGAFLTGADLSDADLSGADLRQAFIYGAKVGGANFAGAKLEGARWVTGAICGPGSVGECKPLPPTAEFVPRPLTWHLLPPSCRESWSKDTRAPSADQAGQPSLPPGCGDPFSSAPKLH